MEALPTVLLKPGSADRIVAGHPWVYRGSLLRLTHPATDGQVVQVKDHRQRFLGIGFYNSKSKINVRVLATERVDITPDFFEQRIRVALALRKKHLPSATAFRVVNAESDFLSGLIVDKYEDVLVVQISSLGMDQRKDMITAALQRIFSPRAILERSETASRQFEGLPEANGLLAGDVGELRPRVAPGLQPDVAAPSPGVSAGPPGVCITITLNGLQFEVDLGGGHKTGLYLDQQVNYARVAELARGAQVLDCFSFAGGFGLHAARAGAAHAHFVDQSADAIAAAGRNAAANGLSDLCTFDIANVFDWLKDHTRTGPNEKLVPKFDLIVLDPPSFTRNRAAVPDALRGYKEIHLRSLKLLKPGGVLATFCCSHHVNADLFQDSVLSAAFDSRHILRRVATYTQSPDHPIVPMIPETEYLKGFAFELVR